MYTNANGKNRHQRASNTNASLLSRENIVLLSDNRSNQEKGKDLLKIIDKVIVPSGITSFLGFTFLTDIQPRAVTNLARIYNPDSVRAMQKDMFNGAAKLGVFGAPVDHDRICQLIEQVVLRFNYNAVSDEVWDRIIPKIYKYIVLRGVRAILATGAEYMESIDNLYDQMNPGAHTQFLTDAFTGNQVGVGDVSNFNWRNVAGNPGRAGTSGAGSTGAGAFVDTYGSKRLQSFVKEMQAEQVARTTPEDRKRVSLSKPTSIRSSLYDYV